ncbi:unnamed protein product [Echinostoma caproni]|uniref:UBC core domain-containing protein n=1 Tax=Echinostoma caproni TaxID=27848 RepID=A0A183ALC2_9TREM|nr:unnamed protein product [Echinostoma caproni]
MFISILRLIEVDVIAQDNPYTPRTLGLQLLKGTWSDCVLLMVLLIVGQSQVIPTDMEAFEVDDDLPRWKAMDLHEWVPRFGRIKRKPLYITGGIRY